VANYPGAFDSAASLFTPVDAFSGKPLETTTIAQVPLMASTTPKPHFGPAIVQNSVEVPQQHRGQVLKRGQPLPSQLDLVHGFVTTLLPSVRLVRRKVQPLSSRSLRSGFKRN
jgi:hypothetical protein